jgi:GAF domain-containing protein
MTPNPRRLGCGISRHTPGVTEGLARLWARVAAMTEFTENVDGAPKSPLTSEQIISDAADLQAGIGALAGLVSDSLGLPELLAEVAGFAVRAIPGADGAGVTLLRVDRVDNMVEALAASAPFVAEIDDIQYVTLKEGPCITAALERRTVRSRSLGGEKMWPRFGPRVGRLGIHSALSLPLLLPDQVVGAINVYAHGKDVFDEHAAELGELFAKPAAVAVHNAQILSQAMTLTAQLQTALSTRPVIDQAIGLLRGRTGRSAEDAFTQLRTISQNDHRKLADVAQQIVDEAVRRARARHNPT